MNPIQRLRAYREHLRFKYAPRLAGWLVEKSTFRACAMLRRSGPLAILVDNTVLHHAVTHETTWVTTGTSNWGPHQIETGYAARIPVHAAESDSREYRNVKFLPGIAHLAKIGLLTLHSSAELLDEQFRQPTGRYRGYSYFDFSIFGDVPIKSIDDFVFPTMGPSYFNLPSAAEQQRARLDQANDGLHAALVERLGPRNSQDAWHIRTAEAHGLFCFLTMDFKLKRTIEALAKKEPVKSLRTRVMTPEELGLQLGLIPVPPHLLSYNDASFFVRSDLCWPDGKRRPLSSYRKKGRTHDIN